MSVCVCVCVSVCLSVCVSVSGCVSVGVSVGVCVCGWWWCVCVYVVSTRCGWGCRIEGAGGSYLVLIRGESDTLATGDSC